MPRRHSSESPPLETQFQAETDDSQNLWEAEAILDERGPPSKGEYLVQWKGIDPDTHETWEPTWEAKAGCTPSLIQDWKAAKKRNPLVVGRAGKELQDRAKEKEKRKRKRDSVAAAEGGKWRSKKGRLEIKVKKEPPSSTSKVPNSAASSAASHTYETRARSGSFGTPSPHLPQGTSTRASSSKPSPPVPARTRRGDAASASPRKPKLKVRSRMPPPESPAASASSQNSRSPTKSDVSVAEDAAPSAPEVGADAGPAIGGDAPRPTRGRRKINSGKKGKSVDRGEMPGSDALDEGEVELAEKGVGAAVENVPAARGEAEPDVEGADMGSAEKHVHMAEEAAVEDGNSEPVHAGDGPEHDGWPARHLSDIEEERSSRMTRASRQVTPPPPPLAVAAVSPATRTTPRREKRTIALSDPSPPNRDRALGPVPIPSQSIFKSFLPTPSDREANSTQTTRSAGISQADPIGQFSSPSQGSRRGRPATRKGVIENGQEADVEMEEVEAEEPKSRLVKRIIDGDEVYVVEESGSDDMDLEEDDNNERDGGLVDQEGETQRLEAMPIDEELMSAVVEEEEERSRRSRGEEGAKGGEVARNGAEDAGAAVEDDDFDVCNSPNDTNQVESLTIAHSPEQPSRSSAVHGRPPVPARSAIKTNGPVSHSSEVPHPASPNNPLLVDEELRIAALTTELNKRNDEVLALQSQLKERESALQALTEQASGAEHELGELRAKAVEDAQADAALRTQVASRGEELEAARKRFTDRDFEVQSLRAQVLSRDTELQDLQARLSGQEAAIQAAEERSQAKEREVQELRAEASKRNAEMQALASEVESSKAEMQALRSSATSADALSQALQKQLSERDTLLAAREKEVSELQDRLAASSAAATGATDSLHGDLDARDRQVKDLQSELDHAATSYKNLSEQYGFVQQQYKQASDAAVREVNTSRSLATQVDRLKGQLSLGLKQKDLHFGAIKQKLEEETLKLRLQNKVLLDQARATGDEVREKASLYMPVQKENEGLKQEIKDLTEQLEKFKERNEELAQVVEILRARQMGALDQPDEQAEDATSEEGSDEDDAKRRGLSSSGIFASADPTTLGYATAPVVGMGSSVSYYAATTGTQPAAERGSLEEGEEGEESGGRGASQLMPTESQFAPVHRHAGGEAQVDGEVGEDAEGWFGCKWQEGGQHCAVLVETREALAKHGLAHIRGLIDAGGMMAREES